MVVQTYHTNLARNEATIAGEVQEKSAEFFHAANDASLAHVHPVIQSLIL